MPDRTPRRRSAKSGQGEETKICPVCQRPFSNRRKWRAIWDQVIYCSERCRRQKSNQS